MPALDHLAFPSFDPQATHRFYSEIMGFPLVFAMDGDSPSWKKKYLLTAYAIGDDRFLDFFSYEGMRRPKKDALPIDIRHVAFSVDSQAEVKAWRKRLDRHRVSYWTEEHG